MSVKDILITGRSARLPGDYEPQGTEAPSDDTAGRVAPVSAYSCGNVVTIIVHGTPIGKPRMTRRDKWKQRPAVLRYRAWADQVRAIAGVLPPAEKVLSLSWTAYFEPPKSWPKSRRAGVIGMLHRSKPDRDNVDKACLDILYPGGDQGIAHGMICKRWDWTPRLEIRIEVLP